MTENRPKVGVGIIVKHNHQLLIGKRISSHGKATWQFPGGHLEFGEEIFDFAIRETLEETGIHITNLTLGPFIDDNKHYITIFVRAETLSPIIINNEPDKAINWQWKAPKDLPTELFLPIKNLLCAHPDFLNF